MNDCPDGTCPDTQENCEPCAPCEPCEPCAPCEPCEPCAPCDACEPSFIKCMIKAFKSLVKE